MKLGIIGGDKREQVLINILASKGYSLQVLKKPPVNDNPLIKYYTDLKSVVKDVDAVIAPMSGTDEEGFLRATFIEEKIKLDQEFFNLMKEDALFFIGIARPTIKTILEKKGIQYIEMAQLDEVAILNAIPTAEGAIKLAIEETDFTIFGSKTLVLGLGRVGLTLAWRLRQLGSESYAVTRERAAIARGRDLGIKMINYEELNEYLTRMNILFNTVPAKVLKRENISFLQKDTLIIDLASSPGGTDFKAAQEIGINAILAPGLPGKIAPRTAGKIMADIIPDLLTSLRRCKHGIKR